jgi:hypothetical protein
MYAGYSNILKCLGGNLDVEQGLELNYNHLLPKQRFLHCHAYYKRFGPMKLDTRLYWLVPVLV